MSATLVNRLVTKTSQALRTLGWPSQRSMTLTGSIYRASIQAFLRDTEAFIGTLAGRNFGKALVRIS